MTKWRQLQQNGHQIHVLHAKISFDTSKSNMAAISIVGQENTAFEENVGAFFQKGIDYLKHSIDISYGCR